MSKAISKYKMFHGKDPKKKRMIDFHTPGTLIVLGEAVAIEYHTNKLNGGGDGKFATYRHEFETPALVCMDERSKKQLYIIGNAIKITEAGIEH